jgi:hypothetical protein
MKLLQSSAYVFALLTFSFSAHAGSIDLPDANKQAFDLMVEHGAESSFNKTTGAESVSGEIACAKLNGQVSNPSFKRKISSTKCSLYFPGGSKELTLNGEVVFNLLKDSGASVGVNDATGAEIVTSSIRCSRLPSKISTPFYHQEVNTYSCSFYFKE